MFFLIVVAVGVLLGYLFGGRLSGLGKLQLRWLPLVFIALVIQLLIFPSFRSTALLMVAQAPLHIVSYVLLVGWLIVNIRTLPVVLLGAGALCNFAVLSLNGGFMPASNTALQRAGLDFLANRLLEEGTYANLIPMTPDTHLNVLGDVLYLPAWIPFSTAFSIGDLLIMLALIWLIVKGMRIDAKRTSKAP